MNYSLDHLPVSRQDHLSYIVAVLRDEFEQVTGFANGKKKHSKILKIILFGSHATGKWVNDPAHGYVSDYDILVILNRDELVDEYKIWNTAEQRIAIKVRPPVNFLIHTLSEVNDALVEGQYFFSDIKREGIILYECDRRKLAKAGKLTAEEYKAIAQKHFAQWYYSANEFLVQYQFALNRKTLKIAAFLLHQAAERYYSCLLLVLTNYKSSTHNLVQLNNLAILQNEAITEVFPQDSKPRRRCFQLLKQAYVDSRYSEHYHITREELEWLAERVQLLQQLTEKLCMDKIESFNQQESA